MLLPYMDEQQSNDGETELLQAVQRSVFGGVSASARRGAISDQLFDYQRECYRSLYGMVEYSLMREKHHSVLLVGFTGSGKTFLVECVLARLGSEYRLGTDVYVVKLNGLIHRSGPAAVEQIIIDLKIGVKFRSTENSFVYSFTLLLEYFYQKEKKKTPIIFILDNLDLFTKHKNQNLLYTLFQIYQSNSWPISVVGITAKWGVTEVLEKLLEKRLKYRFYHRELYLATDYTFPDFSWMVRKLLDPPFIENEEWSEHVHATLCHPLVQSSLKQLFFCSKNLCVLQKLLATPISRLRERGMRFEPQDFQDSWHCINPDPMMQKLYKLSLLEKCIIISASKLHANNPNAKLSFDDIYQEYELFARSSSSICLQSRDQALRALGAVGHRAKLSLLCETNGITDTSCVTLLVSREQVKWAILDASFCPTDIIQWAGTLSSSS